MKALGLSSLAALGIQPFVFLLLIGLPFLFSSEPFPLRELGSMSLLVVIIAAAHLVVLGLPLFYLLWWSNRLSWPAVSLAGFVTGCVAIAVLSWPLLGDLGNYSSGGTWYGQYREFVVNGTPTPFGWLRYIEGLAFFGLHGFAGALAFYSVWRKLRPNNSFKPSPLRGLGQHRFSLGGPA